MNSDGELKGLTRLPNFPDPNSIGHARQSKSKAPPCNHRTGLYKGVGEDGLSHPHECQNPGFPSRILYCREIFDVIHFNCQWFWCCGWLKQHWAVHFIFVHSQLYCGEQKACSGVKHVHSRPSWLDEGLFFPLSCLSSLFLLRNKGFLRSPRAVMFCRLAHIRHTSAREQ